MLLIWSLKKKKNPESWMERLSRKSIKHGDARKLKAGQVLRVEHTKGFQRTYLDCLFGNKKGVGLKLYVGKVMLIELWNFGKKTSLKGNSINLVLLLGSPLTLPLINCPHLFCLSLVYHEMGLQLNQPADYSSVWPWIREHLTFYPTGIRSGPELDICSCVLLRYSSPQEF